MKTLENNEKKLFISMTSDDSFSIANLLNNIEFFKLGFHPETLQKIIDSAEKQHYNVDDKVFKVIYIFHLF